MASSLITLSGSMAALSGPFSSHKLNCPSVSPIVLAAPKMISLRVNAVSKSEPSKKSAGAGLLPKSEKKTDLGTEMIKRKTEERALGRYLSLSADKARRVIDQIRGRSYEEALMILELMPYGACYPIFKLVYSAAANASHNLGSEKGNLVISKAEVNQGPTSKRFRPKARGRSYAIRRRTCHITIVVKDTSLDEWE